MYPVTFQSKIILPETFLAYFPFLFLPKSAL